MVGVLLESVAYQKYIGSCSGHEGKKMDVKRYVQLLGLRNARLRRVHVNFEHDQQPQSSWDIERGADGLLKVRPAVPDETSWSQFFEQAD